MCLKASDLFKGALDDDNRFNDDDDEAVEGDKLDEVGEDDEEDEGEPFVDDPFILFWCVVPFVDVKFTCPFRC